MKLITFENIRDELFQDTAHVKFVLQIRQEMSVESNSYSDVSTFKCQSNKYHGHRNMSNQLPKYI